MRWLFSLTQFPFSTQFFFLLFLPCSYRHFSSIKVCPAHEYCSLPFSKYSRFFLLSPFFVPVVLWLLSFFYSLFSSSPHWLSLYSGCSCFLLFYIFTPDVPVSSFSIYLSPSSRLYLFLSVCLLLRFLLSFPSSFFTFAFWIFSIYIYFCLFLLFSFSFLLFRIL